MQMNNKLICNKHNCNLQLVHGGGGGGGDPSTFPKMQGITQII